MSKPQPLTRADFRFFSPIQTRWMDNDMFGHVNNVQYYRFFEMAVTDFLSGPGQLDWMADPVVPFAAESLCRFRRPLSWPERVEAGLRIEHLGNTSIRWGMALFREGEHEASADGHWVHVFVEREGQRPAPIPDKLRKAFEEILAG